MSLADLIMGVESGNNPLATNPNSSATGAGQFLAGTWLDTLARHRPDLQGSKEELLALRTDPGLSKEMTAAYAADNAAALSKAGLEPTPGNTYLAHFAGPQGAVSILKSDPNAPVASILGQKTVEANPFLQKMTAADLQAWASRKIMGQPTPAPQRTASLLPPPAAALPDAQPAQPQQAEQQQPEPASGGGSLFTAPPPSIAAPPMAQAPPIYVPPQRHIDLSKLKAALASGNRGLFLGRG